MKFLQRADGGVQVTDEKGNSVKTMPLASGGLQISGSQELLRTLSEMKSLNESVEQYMARMAKG